MADDIGSLVASHRFFSHMGPESLKHLHDNAGLRIYKQGALLGQEGYPSNFFFALLDGQVAIESYQPGFEPIILQTLHGGEILGWSWLFPPFEWVFDARALTDVRTLAFDAQNVRDACEADLAFGYDLVKRFAQVMTQRLKATRLRLLDVYGRRSEHTSLGPAP